MAITSVVVGAGLFFGGAYSSIESSSDFEKYPTINKYQNINKQLTTFNMEDFIRNEGNIDYYKNLVAQKDSIVATQQYIAEKETQQQQKKKGIGIAFAGLVFLTAPSIGIGNKK